RSVRMPHAVGHAARCHVGVAIEVVQLESVMDHLGAGRLRRLVRLDGLGGCRGEEHACRDGERRCGYCNAFHCRLLLPTLTVGPETCGSLWPDAGLAEQPDPLSGSRLPQLILTGRSGAGRVD